MDIFGYKNFFKCVYGMLLPYRNTTDKTRKISVTHKMNPVKIIIKPKATAN